jgi:hypothetical protein
VIAPAGAPPATDPDDAPMPDQDQQFRALVEHLALVNDATRAFNRSVPAAFKASYPQRLPTDAPIRDPWVEQFFSWVAPALHTGHGLYLWA